MFAEPTRVKYLSGAPLKGRPLALPTYIILGFKGFPELERVFVTVSVFCPSVMFSAMARALYRTSLYG